MNTMAVRGSKGNIYRIDVHPRTGEARCTCKAWQYSKPGAKYCKHLEIALAELLAS